MDNNFSQANLAEKNLRRLFLNCDCRLRYLNKAIKKSVFNKSDLTGCRWDRSEVLDKALNQCVINGASFKEIVWDNFALNEVNFTDAQWLPLSIGGSMMKCDFSGVV